MEATAQGWERSLLEFAAGAVPLLAVAGAPAGAREARAPLIPPGVAAHEHLPALPASVEPVQIISLMTLGGPSFALSGHYDHIHVGF